jgi:carbamoyl-phosphate synthase large subunit
VLVDRFLEDAIEVDVDCIADGEISVIGAIMEHIEQAGVHSGDSACVIPAPTLSEKVKNEIRAATIKMARALDVRGLMNVQFAVKDEVVYVLEVNPRASRTVPFVSKAIGVPLAKLAAKVMTGAKLKDLGFTREIIPTHYSLKEAVFPFAKFRGTDILLGPEMKSTGEVMGLDFDYAIAFAKSQLGGGTGVPFRHRVHFLKGKRPAPHHRRDRAAPERCRLQADRDLRHPTVPGRARSRNREDQQGVRGPPAHRGCDQERQGATRFQHHRRRASPSGFTLFAAGRPLA